MNVNITRGKSIIITGANSGIGKTWASALAAMGAHIIMACRQASVAKGAVQDKETRLAKKAMDDRAANKLWRISAEMTELAI